VSVRTSPSDLASIAELRRDKNFVLWGQIIAERRCEFFNKWYYIFLRGTQATPQNVEKISAAVSHNWSYNAFEWDGGYRSGGYVCIAIRDKVDYALVAMMGIGSEK
jgi:hypothetical protein